MNLLVNSRQKEENHHHSNSSSSSGPIMQETQQPINTSDVGYAVEQNLLQLLLIHDPSNHPKTTREKRHPQLISIYTQRNMHNKYSHQNQWEEPIKTSSLHPNQKSLVALVVVVEQKDQIIFYKSISMVFTFITKSFISQFLDLIIASWNTGPFFFFFFFFFVLLDTSCDC